MPSCSEIRNDLQVQLDDLQRQALLAQRDLSRVIMNLMILKGELCAAGWRNYNLTCCSAFSARFDLILPQYLDSEYRLQLIQQCSDAIAAIDCTSLDWETQVAEAVAQLLALATYIADMIRETAILNAWLRSQQLACPVVSIYAV